MLLYKIKIEIIIDFQEEAASSKADIIKQLRAADANKTKSKIHAPDKNIPGATNYQVNSFFSFARLFINPLYRFWMIMMLCLIKQI